MDTKWHAVVRGSQSTPSKMTVSILWTGKMGENGQRFIWIAKSLWVQTVGTLSSVLLRQIKKLDRYRLGHLSVRPRTGLMYSQAIVTPFGEERCLCDQVDWKLKPGKHRMVGPTSLSWKGFSSSCAKKSIWHPLAHIISSLPPLFFREQLQVLRPRDHWDFPCIISLSLGSYHSLANLLFEEAKEPSETSITTVWRFSSFSQQSS